MVDELSPEDQAYLNDPTHGEFNALYSETVPGDDEDAPEIAKVSGDAQERALVYYAIQQEMMDNVAQGYPTQVTEDQLYALTWGVMHDGDAMDILKHQGVELFNPQEFGTLLYANGERNKAIAVQQAWRMADTADPEPLQDDVIMAAVSLGGSVAVTGSRAGFTATIKGLPALAAWSSKGAARSAAPATSRLFSRLVASGMSKSQAAVAATRGALYGKLPTNTALYVNGVERIITNPSLRGLFRKATVGNFLGAVINEGFAMADSYANPEAWDEADREAIQGAIDKQAEALQMELDDDAFNDLAQLGIEVDQPNPRASIEGAGQVPDNVGSFGAAPVPANAQRASGPAPDSPPNGIEGLSYITDGSNAYQGPYTANSGLANIYQNQAIQRDRYGNPISVDFSQIETDDELALVLQEFAKPTSEDDPLLGGVREGFIAETDRDGNLIDTRGVHGGVKPSFIADRTPPSSYDQGAPVPVLAQYRGSTAYDTLYNMNPGDLENFQQQGIRAGLINPADPTFVLGSRDQQTMDAMTTTMGHANNTGKGWERQLQAMVTSWQKKLQEDKDANEKKKPLFVPSSAYQSIDPEWVRQKVQSDIEKQLGRSANDWEMGEFGSYLQANHRANYDDMISVEKSIWEARGRAALGEDPGSLPELQQVDEESRYQAKFEERYETELEEVDRWDRMKRDTNTLFRSFDNMSNQLGGV